MKFEITPDDLKHVSNFEPQVCCEMINRIVRTKLARYLGLKIECEHPKAELKKMGKISDPQFEHLSYKYFCPDCDQVVVPTSFK